MNRRIDTRRKCDAHPMQDLLDALADRVAARILQAIPVRCTAHADLEIDPQLAAQIAVFDEHNDALSAAYAAGRRDEAEERDAPNFG